MPSFLMAEIGALYLESYRACGSRFREQNFPLDFDQVPVLLLLHYGGAASQQEIYTKLQRDKASVNRTVASLTKKGFTTVKPDSADKRKTIVELTPLGKNLAKQGNAILEKYDNMLSSSLTTKERQLFSDLIGKLNIQS
jgi:DNA-binding MarR family transcriptional regulator